MATVNQNAVQYGIIGGQGFKQIHVPIAHSTNPIKQGELVFLDTTAHLAKPVTSSTDALTLLGVALQPSAVSSNLDNVGAPAEKSVMVAWDVVASLKTTAAETYYHGTAVYVGADAQTITTVAGTNSVGAICLPAGVASVTGVAGLLIGVVVKSKVF